MASVGNQTLTNNEHVSVELKFPKTVLLSKSSKIEFFLTPTEGIHINTSPMVEFRLEKNSSFEIVGNPAFQSNENGYLETDKPIEFTVKPKSGSHVGKKSLKGKLNYFYCSDKDGWCNRFTQPIDLTIEISK